MFIYMDRIMINIQENIISHQQRNFQLIIPVGQSFSLTQLALVKIRVEWFFFFKNRESVGVGPT